MYKNIIKTVSILLVLCIIITIYIVVTKEKPKEGLDNMEETEKTEENIKVKITIDNQSYDAIFYLNNTTKKMIESFPLEINMKDLNKNEKYYYLDNNLPTLSTKIDTINTGDIMLFGNNCLVLFYETFSNSYTYTKIGKINNPDGIKDIMKNDTVKVTFELIEN